MSEYARQIAADTVQMERDFPVPLATVWAYLIEPERRATWFAGGTIEPKTGGAVALFFDHKNLSSLPIPERFRAGADGQFHHGRVTDWNPPHKLAFLWGTDATASEVVFELSALTANSTRLVLTHRRVPDAATKADVSGGWHSHLGLLGDLLAGRPPAEFWDRVYQAEAHYKVRYGHPEAIAVRLSQTFETTAERVFDAWLDPAMIARWMFGPALRDEQIVSLTVDPRIGGQFSFVVRRQDQLLDHQGEYLELERPHRLVFTWGVNQPNASRVLIDITTTPRGSQLELLHELPPEWAAYADRTQAGWRTMTDQLLRALG